MCPPVFLAVMLTTPHDLWGGLQATRIGGVSPADITALMLHLSILHKRSAREGKTSRKSARSAAVVEELRHREEVAKGDLKTH